MGGVLFAGSSASFAQTIEPGYASDGVRLDPRVFYGGLALLPNGDLAVYDGRKVLEIDRNSGAPVNALLVFAGSPFGSFLEMSPDGQKLYFGESSSGAIHEIDLAGGGARQVAQFSFPYDLAFDRDGTAYVSWSPGFFQGGRISSLDLATGRTDLVLVAGGASGPLLFDDRGGLLYAVADTNWPPPPDSTPILRFTRAQLRAARGVSWLTEADGKVVALVDGAHSMVRDESGDLFVTDSVYGDLVEIDHETGVERKLFDGPDFQGLTYLVFAPPADGDAFEAFQPSSSGELIALRSDFVTYNELRSLRPQRPLLETNPPSPIPAGPFDLLLHDGVPNGVTWLWVTASLAPTETRYSNDTWPAPLYFGLDFTNGILLRQSFALDAQGEFTYSGDATGLSGLSLGVQAVVGTSAAGPYFGTSQPLALSFQ